MKVLQVIDTFGTGGAERVAVDLTNILHDSGVDVEVLTILAPGPLSIYLKPQVKLTSLFRQHRFDKKSILAFIRIAQQCDIMHVHMRHNYRYCRLLCLIFSIKTPIVLHDHNGIDSSVPILFRTLLKPAWYIGVSNMLTIWAAERLKIPKARVLLLGNIILPYQPSSPCVEKQGIVLISNIKPIKNLLFAVSLLPQLNLNMTIIGKAQDQIYFEKLQSDINYLGIAEKVHFKHNCTNIQQELPCFRLGLHTSVSESGPLVLIEYLAQNLPFLAYATGEVARILRPEFPKFFIDNLDPAQWAQRIEVLLNETQDVQKMQRVFVQYFNSQQYADKCLNFYQKIAADY